MKALTVNIPIEYKDIFDDPILTYEELMSEISSSHVLKILGYINGLLFRDGNGIKTQRKILALFLKNQDEVIKETILEKIKLKVRRIKDAVVVVFSEQTILEFIHKEVSNFRELPSKQLSQSQELNILKAYLLIVAETNERYIASMPPKAEYQQHYFERVTWPSFLDQFEINKHLSPLPAFIRGLVLLTHFHNHNDYKQYVSNFLSRNSADSIWKYGSKIIDLLMARIDDSHPMVDLRMAFIPVQNELTSFLEIFALDIQEYADKYVLDKKRYEGLKRYPILIIENEIVILSWTFLLNKLYEGLVFDFYNHSGISNEEKFKKFIDFKNYIASEITEKVFFRKLIRYIFNDRRSTIHFCDKTPNFPDAYVRLGNKLFLFELKDSYFQASAAGSLNFDKVKSEINLKLNSSGKGTGQLLKQLDFLKEDRYPCDNGYKTKNTHIFPIIVYTDVNFGMPGINRAVKEDFTNRISENDLNKHFAKIHPLTLISLEHLTFNVCAIKKNAKKLHEDIKKYHSKIQKRQKLFYKNRLEKTYFSIQSSFEQEHEINQQDLGSTQIFREIFDINNQTL